MFAVADTTDAIRKETVMMKPVAATTLLLSLLTLAAPARAQTSTAFKPFTGAGVGARTHDYRHVNVATTHHLTTYASVGGELGLARVRVRLEVRDYLSWTTPVGRPDATRRNDVAVLAGLRLALR
jgi:hypothetical protein